MMESMLPLNLSGARRIFILKKVEGGVGRLREVEEVEEGPEMFRGLAIENP